MKKSSLLLIGLVVVLIALGIVGFLQSQEKPDDVSQNTEEIFGDTTQPVIAPEPIILTSPSGELQIQTPENGAVVTSEPNVSNSNSSATQLLSFPISGRQFSFIIASDQASRTQGLSGVSSLPEQNGMLFIFQDNQPNNGFWMKDMQFPIDIIWLDETGAIVSIEANASPESYLQSPPQVFYPNEISRFVIELNAGQAQELGLTIGSEIDFPEEIFALANIEISPESEEQDSLETQTETQEN